MKVNYEVLCLIRYRHHSTQSVPTSTPDYRQSNGC